VKTNKDVKRNFEPRSNSRWLKLSEEAGATAMGIADTAGKSAEYDPN